MDADGLSTRKISKYFAKLAIEPLWSGKTPPSIAKSWQSAAADNRASHFGPWIDWYQVLLTGNGPSANYFGPDLTLRIAKQPDEGWGRPVGLRRPATATRQDAMGAACGF